jgi:cytochrome c oxidase accessory protein FixG
MMDEDTITIAYREWRGEPRGKQSVAGNGDCIDCMACVNVCPMGIDIRNGQQLECITCGLCIDACDEMMDKIGKPRGLISYLALKDEAMERAGGAPLKVWKHIFRPRTMIYFVLWAGIGVGLVAALFLRAPVDFNVTPLRQPIYVTLSDGSIRNAYDIRLRNKQNDETEFRLSVTAPDAVRTELEGAEADTILVAADKLKTQRLYVIAPKGAQMAHAERSEITIWVEDIETGLRVGEAVVFNGDEK